MKKGRELRALSITNTVDLNFKREASCMLHKINMLYLSYLTKQLFVLLLAVYMQLYIS